jgi:quinolinate synthase
MPGPTPVSCSTWRPADEAGKLCRTLHSGGCASCPYMKMNSLAALMAVCAKVGSAAGAAMLVPFEPRKYESPGGGVSIAEVRARVNHVRHVIHDTLYPRSVR